MASQRGEDQLGERVDVRVIAPSLFVVVDLTGGGAGGRAAVAERRHASEDVADAR